MMARLKVDDVDALAIGAAVTVAFEDVTDEITLPCFRQA